MRMSSKSVLSSIQRIKQVRAEAELDPRLKQEYADDDEINASEDEYLHHLSALADAAKGLSDYVDRIPSKNAYHKARAQDLARSVSTALYDHSRKHPL